MAIKTSRAVAANQGYVAKDEFTYSIRFQNLVPNNGTAVGQFTVDAACDFMWQKATFWTLSENESIDTLFANILFTITETGTGRQITNVPTPITGVFGNGTWPAILPTAKLFRARSTITMKLINPEAAITGVTFANVYANFIGTQLFLARAK